MTKYEYTVNEGKTVSATDEQTYLNKMGADGWKIVNLDYNGGFYRIVFMREVEKDLLLG